MPKIENIKRTKTISYEEDRIEYFVKENSNSLLKDYSEIINKIKNAKSMIKIASTSYIDENIIDAIYEIDKERILNSYLILKDFSKSSKTLQRFDERKPMVIREVKELKNNFILIDNKAYLFLNPLSEKENIFLEFDEAKSSDLEFIFNYYFWNEATQEKLINEISKPTESPFPPFSLREQEYVNVEEVNTEYKAVYIPKDKKYNDELNKKSSKNYFSEDIKIPIYINDNDFYIGNFKVSEKITLNNSWILKENKLGSIDSHIEIIPREKSWSESIKIEEKKEVNLQDIVATSIDTMNNTQPNEFTQKEFVKEITFIWNVLPPMKPKNSKKSSLYSEHEQYEKKIKKYQEDKIKTQKTLDEEIEENNNLKIKLSKVDKKDKSYKEIQKKLDKSKQKIDNLKKDITKKESIKKPKYPLPSIGILYESNNQYFLEISDKNELNDAKKLETIYTDKEFCIVASSY